LTRRQNFTSAVFVLNIAPIFFFQALVTKECHIPKSMETLLPKPTNILTSSSNCMIILLIVLGAPNPSHYVRLITRNGLAALGTGFVIPGMRCATVLTMPSFALHFQPLRQAYFTDDFHVFQDELPVRVLRICHELAHEIAGTYFTALIAEFKTFALGASLDAAGGAKPGRSFAFAPVTLLGLLNFPDPGCQNDRAPQYTPQYPCKM
jgi:hypothetical protein